MDDETRPLMLSDFTDRDWETVAIEADERTTSAYHQRFLGRAKRAEADADTIGLRAFKLLTTVFCYALRAEDQQSPFLPPFNGIIEPQDFESTSLDVLGELAQVASDDELKARLADIVWFARRKPFQLAPLAIRAYVASAKRLDAEGEWIEALMRFERASNLAISLGKGGASQLKEVVDSIAGVVRDRGDFRQYRGYALGLSELLQTTGLSDPITESQRIERMAHQAETGNDLFIAQQLWNVKAGWDHLANDPDSQKASRIQAAEMSVRMADAASPADASGFLVAAHHLQQAIESLRQLGERARADELHARMLELQAKAVPLVSGFSQEFDITPFAEKARASVTGRPLIEALTILTLLASPSSVERLGKRADTGVEAHPVLSLFDTIPIDADGRAIARKPSRFSDDPESVVRARRADMLEIANQDRGLDVHALIEPARLQILLEHSVRPRDLVPFLTDHPLVPVGREAIYARGLVAGLRGDFLVACHLLIPQIEHALRVLFRRMGAIESSLESDGLQEAHNLNALLYKGELSQIFDEDTIFELQGLLVEKFGANLRNRMAHGLMSHAEFEGAQAKYLWWLVLHLLFRPVVASMNQRESGSSSDAANSQSH